MTNTRHKQLTKLYQHCTDEQLGQAAHYCGRNLGTGSAKYEKAVRDHLLVIEDIIETRK